LGIGHGELIVSLVPSPRALRRPDGGHRTRHRPMRRHPSVHPLAGPGDARHPEQGHQPGGGWQPPGGRADCAAVEADSPYGPVEPHSAHTAASSCSQRGSEQGQVFPHRGQICTCGSRSMPGLKRPPRETPPGAHGANRRRTRGGHFSEARVHYGEIPRWRQG